MTSLCRRSGPHAIGYEFDSSKCYFFVPYSFVYLFHFFFSFLLL